MEKKEENVCFRCGRSFCNKYALEKHVSTTKYCLNKGEIETVDKPKYQCPFCPYSTFFKTHLTRHLKTCKEKKRNLDIENALLKQELNEYKDLEASQTFRISEENKIKFLQEFTTSLETKDLDNLVKAIEEDCDYLTLSHGQEGFAQFVNNQLNKNNKKLYVTTDKTATTFVFKDSEGKIRTDDNAQMLIGVIQEPFRKAIERVARESAKLRFEDPFEAECEEHKLKREYLKEVTSMVTKGKKFRNCLANFTYVSPSTMREHKDRPDKAGRKFDLLITDEKSTSK